MSIAAPQDLSTWHPHLSVWVVMAASLGLYALAARRWGPTYVRPGESPVTMRKAGLFALGISFLWIAADWPLHDLAERYLFSVHMTQHLVFSLIGPPLILLGTPDWMARLILRPKWVMGIARRLTRPLPALIMFNGYLVLSHWPKFVDVTVSNEIAHFSAHVILVFLSLVMWAPVLSPLPEIRRISAPAQMIYLFGQTIVPTVPASFLTLAEKPFYRAYAEAPRIVEGFTALADQRLAGVIMKLGGGFYLWSIIAVLFFRWSSREERGEPDVAEWQDLERQVNQEVGSDSR